MSDTKTNNSYFQVIIQKVKKNHIGVDLPCIIIELHCIYWIVSRTGKFKKKQERTTKTRPIAFKLRSGFLLYGCILFSNLFSSLFLRLSKIKQFIYTRDNNQS